MQAVQGNRHGSVSMQVRSGRAGQAWHGRPGQTHQAGQGRAGQGRQTRQWKGRETHRAEQAIRTRQGRTGQGNRLGRREEQAGQQEGKGKECRPFTPSQGRQSWAGRLHS